MEIYNKCGNYCYQICPRCKQLVLCEHCLLDSPMVKDFVCSGIKKCSQGSAFSNPHINQYKQYKCKKEKENLDF